jgi:tetratricopeptide (TPR) repeat protein
MQGLGPTGNAFQLQLELMELDLDPVRKNLELAEKRLRRLKDKKHAVDEDTASSDGDEEELSERDLQHLRARLMKEINTREIEIFRVKADRFPTDTSHRIELGTRLLKADLVEEAIAELQQAKRDEKLKWRAAMLLGMCFKKRNNWRLAQRNFEDALAAVPPTDEPSRKELLYQLASGCAENGDLSRAMDLGHELANLDYGFKNIGKLLDEWNDRMQSA